MTNVDTRFTEFKRRLLNLAEERQRIAEDEREIGVEMKSEGITSTQQKGIKLAVKRALEEPDRRAERIAVEEIAESLGDFADLPLGRAAIALAQTFNEGVTQ